MTDSGKLSPYRWVIEILIFLALFSQSLTWLAPAPILGPIMASLKITLGTAGLAISIITPWIALFSLLGAVITERLGARRALLAGIWLMAGAQVLSGYSAGLAQLLACRALEGVGFGVMIAPPGALVMQWFGEREWPYVNMVNALCAYVALTFVYGATVPLFLAAGASWQRVLRYYGLGCAATALLWTLFGRERRPLAAPAAMTRPALGEVMRMRGVALIAVGLFGGMWVFQLYAAFLPEYFHEYRALSLAQSSELTAILPLTGIFAAVAGGLGSGLIGLRRPFTWPVALLGIIGAAGVVLAPTVAFIRVWLVVSGIGAAGSLAAVITTLMELPGMTPEKMGSALAFVWAAGYAGAFGAPFAGGAIAQALGLRTALLGFLAVQLLTVGAMYLLPETGPGRTGAPIRCAP